MMTANEAGIHLRPLSSGSTFFFKFLMSPLFVLTALQLTANMAAHHYVLDATTLIQHNWLWIISAAFIFIVFYNIKRVRTDDKNRNLYVSNYLKEIVIPFSQVKKITQGKFPRNRITIHLSDKTVFGDQILFVPLISGGQFINELEARIGVEK